MKVSTGPEGRGGRGLFVHSLQMAHGKDIAEMYRCGAS